MMKSVDDELRFGLTLPVWPFERIVWMAQYADRNGFDVVSLIDHIASPELPYIPEAFVTLASLSSITKRVRLMTGVSDPHRRHPAVAAQMAATLDLVSGGRFTFGIGAGEAMNLVPYGIEWRRPVSRLREYILLLKALWTRKPITFKGEFFELKEAQIELETVQKPHPPIWMAAMSERTLQMAGELADGWYPTALPPDVYSTCLERVRNSAKASGRDPADITPAVEIPIAVAKDHDTAEQQIMPLAKAYLALFPKLLEGLGFPRAARKDFGLQQLTLSPESRESLMAFSKNVPSQAVERICPFGTPEECISSVEKYVKAGARNLVFIPMASTDFLQETLLPLLLEKVMPYLKVDS